MYYNCKKVSVLNYLVLLVVSQGCLSVNNVRIMKAFEGFMKSLKELKDLWTQRYWWNSQVSVFLMMAGLGVGFGRLGVEVAVHSFLKYDDRKTQGHSH